MLRVLGVDGALHVSGHLLLCFDIVGMVDVGAVALDL
jgi:hypothetical protein